MTDRWSPFLAGVVAFALAGGGGLHDANGVAVDRGVRMPSRVRARVHRAAAKAE